MTKLGMGSGRDRSVCIILSCLLTRNSAADLVKQELLFVGQEGGKLLAIRNLIQKGFTPPVLIFVQSIERAKELFHELIYDGLNVDVIHSERTQAQRDNVVKSFRAGKVCVCVCVCVCVVCVCVCVVCVWCVCVCVCVCVHMYWQNGSYQLLLLSMPVDMGVDLHGCIDFKGVNLVINYDFPPSAVSYIHRIGGCGMPLYGQPYDKLHPLGRTGRAGRRGHAITFFTEDDALNLRRCVDIHFTFLTCFAFVFPSLLLFCLVHWHLGPQHSQCDEGIRV